MYDYTCTGHGILMQKRVTKPDNKLFFKLQTYTLTINYVQLMTKLNSIKNPTSTNFMPLTCMTMENKKFHFLASQVIINEFIDN